jgi:hypothetical protein
MMKNIEKNEIGLIAFAWRADGYGETLEQQLEKNKVEYETVEIPHLVGMGGAAYLTFYHNPKTHKDMAVLCIPIRYEVDGFAIEYFYFEMNKEREERALESESWWLDAYDRCRELTMPDI